MKAKSIKGNSPEEIKSALQQSMADGFKPTLAIVFLSHKQDRKLFANYWIMQALQYLALPPMVNLLMKNPKKVLLPFCYWISIRLFHHIFAEYPEKNYREVANEIAKKAKTIFHHPAFLIAGSHMETDAEQLLFGFEDVDWQTGKCVWWMAGDDYTF